MRRPDPLDPVVERDLALLDAALAGAPDADAELAALVRDVRAEAPRPAAAFRSALDARVATGFPPAPTREATAGHAARPGRRLREVLRPRILVPALGVVAAALLALVVVTGPIGGTGEQGSPGAPAGPAAGAGSGSGGAAAREGGGADSAASKAAPPVAADQAAPSVAPAPPALATPTTVAPAAPGRKVERTVSLDLGTAAGRFDDVTDGVVRTTQRAGGFVADSRIRRDGQPRHGDVRPAHPERAPRRRDRRPQPPRPRPLDRAGRRPTSPARPTAPPRACATRAPAAARSSPRSRPRPALAPPACAPASPTPRARERSLERALRSLRARTTYATVDLTVTAPAPGGRASEGRPVHPGRRAGATRAARSRSPPASRSWCSPSACHSRSSAASVSRPRARCGAGGARPHSTSSRAQASSDGPASAGAAPTAWKPPSTWRISPVIARASGESRKTQASATGLGSLMSQPSGAWRCQASASASKPSMLLAATVAAGRRRRGWRARRAARGRARGSG